MCTEPRLFGVIMKFANSSKRATGGPPTLGHVLPINRKRVQSRPRDGWLVTVVNISGEIDVSNVEQVTNFAVCSVAADDALLLDMTGVTFFGAQGISMLVTIEDICSQGELPWALVTSPAVERVLYLSGQATVLPVATSVHAAMQYFGCNTHVLARSRRTHRLRPKPAPNSDTSL
jgi:anti-anti-sigma factor